MPWFRNHYVCFACEAHWLAERVEAGHDDCPQCRVFDVAPYKSDDWSIVIETDGDAFVVMEVADVNAHGPNYLPLGKFPDRNAAKAFIATRQAGAAASCLTEFVATRLKWQDDSRKPHRLARSARL